jgi:hypothetical protein
LSSSRGFCLFSRQSAGVCRSLLIFCFFGSPWLSRQLQNGGLLSLAQEGEQYDPAIRKFDRIVMRGRFVLIDLPKNRGAVIGRPLAPRKQAGRHAHHTGGKGQFRSGKNTDRDAGIFRRREPARSDAEVARGQLVANLRGARSDIG